MAAAGAVVVLAASACGGAHRAGTATGAGTATARPSAASARASAATAPGKPTVSVRLPRGVVVRVGPKQITERALEHWIAVEAVAAQPHPTGPVPRGVVPKPPRYAGCITYLARVARRERGGRPPTRARLSSECAQEHEDLQRQVLTMLILYDWIKAEATRAGVAVPAGEIDRELRREFPTSAQLDRYLRFTGIDERDERFIVQDRMLEPTWQRKTLPVYVRLRHEKGPESIQMVGEVDRELENEVQAMTSRWMPRTLCKPGFVVEDCSEFKG